MTIKPPLGRSNTRTLERARSPPLPDQITAIPLAGSAVASVPGHYASIPKFALVSTQKSYNQ
jgi:hypothetical protein